MWKFHQYLYIKQNITWPLGDTNFIFSRWKYLSALEDKIRIPARSGNILYIYCLPPAYVDSTVARQAALLLVLRWAAPS